MLTYWEPDWRSGRNIWTRIGRADGRPLGIAGLWSRWRAPAGDEIFSFTMLTINADQHPFMCNYHRPDDEKRMVVILGEDEYDAWLDAAAQRSMDFMRPYPPGDLVALQEGADPAAAPGQSALPASLPSRAADR